MSLTSVSVLWLLGCGITLAGQAGEFSVEEKEAFLLKAKVLTSRSAPKGITSSGRATLSLGGVTHDAHIQSIEVSKNSFQTDRGTELNFRDSYKFNIAAYRLGRLLGLENMIPPSIERNTGGKSSAVTWWVDDVMMDEGERLRKKLRPPDAERWNKQIYIVRVFDQLIYNTDRNMGNLLICNDWSLQMIDHTRAFRIRKDLENPKNLVQCDRALLNAMRALTKKQLVRELNRYLTETEIAGLLARRDEIVKTFDRKIAEQGEATTLFDYLRARQQDAIGDNGSSGLEQKTRK